MSAPRPLAGIVLAAALAAALATLLLSGHPGVLEEDEGDYLRAATHLTRDGVFAHSSIDADDPRPDAYREPGISFAYAAAWRAFGCPSPVSEAALAGAFAPGSCAGRAVRGVNLLLFSATLAATALAVRAAGGGALAALAAATLVAASPALRLAASGAYTENLAAPLATGVAAALALGVAARDERPRRRAMAAALALAALAPLARSALLALPVAVALVLVFDGRWGRSSRRAALALAGLALGLVPSAIWTARNARQVGVATLVDSRGVLKIREELDRELEGTSLLGVALRWTPLEAARLRGERIAPPAFDQPRWKGEGTYLTRAWRQRGAAMREAIEDGALTPERAALVVDRVRARSALGWFFRHPVEHLRASLPVGWRQLFAERSPDAVRPFDLSFAYGIALALAMTLFAIRALGRRDGAALALLLPALLLAAGHVLLTEGVPRYGWPALPVAWASLVLLSVQPRPAAEASA